jgi:hypothetical protein
MAGQSGLARSLATQRKRILDPGRKLGNGTVLDLLNVGGEQRNENKRKQSMNMYEKQIMNLFNMKKSMK